MARSLFTSLNQRIIFFITSMCTLAICIVVLVSASTLTLNKSSFIGKMLNVASLTIASSISHPYSITKADTYFQNITLPQAWPVVDYLALISPDGTIIRHQGALEFDTEELLVAKRISRPDKIIVCHPIIENNEIKAFVVAGKSISFFDKGFRKFLLVAGCAGSLGIFISFLIAQRLYKRMLHPLYSLTSAAKEIGISKDYSLRVSYAAQDELGDLVNQFNSMLEQIEKRDKLLTSHKTMLEHAVKLRTAELAKKNAQLQLEVAEREEAEMIRCEVERINQHDLKSLLNLVIGYPELLLSKGDLTQDQAKYIRKIEMAGYRILDMINNNLDIFKMEQGIYKLRATSVELVHLLFEIQDDITSMLTRQNVMLRMTYNNHPVTAGNKFTIAGEYRLLQTLFSNLIINAVEASNSDDIVTISIDAENQSIAIHNSTLVPKEIHDTFFNKYVTTGKEDGTGLGTYSAKLIATAHKAHINMVSTAASGTLVTIEFHEQHTGELEPAAEQLLA